MQSVQIEGLENRILFDSTGSISVSKGVLTILGTPQRDIVYIALVTTASGTTLVVNLNQTIQQFDPDSVHHIHIMTGDGDDDIHFFEDGAPRRRIQPSIDAGAGHDMITMGKNTTAGTISGGADSDLIVSLNRSIAPVPPQDAVLFVLSDGLISVRGTDGNDSIYVTDLATLDAPSELEAVINSRAYTWNPYPNSRVIISGRAGNNTISLADTTIPTDGQFSTSYLGTAIPATLIGGSGNDMISAGSGKTALIGGAEDDTLTGSTGHDIFLGGSGRNVINH